METAPAETGPELRLQYRRDEQPKGEYLLIGMDPISDSDGSLKVFHVLRHVDGKSWLYADSGPPDSVWHPDSQWVFVRRKRLKT